MRRAATAPDTLGTYRVVRSVPKGNPAASTSGRHPEDTRPWAFLASTLDMSHRKGVLP